METTAVKLYSTGYREAKTYLAAALFVAGNIVLQIGRASCRERV